MNLLFPCWTCEIPSCREFNMSEKANPCEASAFARRALHGKWHWNCCAGLSRLRSRQTCTHTVPRSARLKRFNDGRSLGREPLEEGCLKWSQSQRTNSCFAHACPKMSKTCQRPEAGADLSFLPGSLRAPGGVCTPCPAGWIRQCGRPMKDSRIVNPRFEMFRDAKKKSWIC